MIKILNPKFHSVPQISGDFTQGVLKRLVLSLEGLRGCDHAARLAVISAANPPVAKTLAWLGERLVKAEIDGTDLVFFAERATPAVWNILKMAAESTVVPSAAAAEEVTVEVIATVAAPKKRTRKPRATASAV